MVIGDPKNVYKDQGPATVFCIGLHVRSDFLSGKRFACNSHGGWIHEAAKIRVHGQKIERTVQMMEFNQVTVVKKANVYFDGKVTSRTVIFEDGTKKTLGIMMCGDYEFGTVDQEIMEILSGSLEVLLPDSSEWKRFGPGESFEIPANSKFSLKVTSIVDYCCSYIK